jgi:DNA-binding transcriptional LysR family regulator
VTTEIREPGGASVEYLADRRPVLSKGASEVDIRSIRYFVAVAEELHFRKAAEKLFISQPGLSQAVKSLEKEIGADLFVRSRRGVALSPVGQAFLPKARELLAHAAEVRAFAGRLVDRHHSTLSLAHTRSAGLGPASELTAAFRAAHPSVALRTSSGFSALNLEHVRSGRVDVAFVRPPLGTSEELGCLQVAMEEVLAALPIAHPLAGLDEVPPEKIAGEPLVFFPREAGGLWESMLEAVYGDAGPARISREEPDEAHMLTAVAEGAGITLLTEGSAAVLDVPGVVLRRLAGAPSVPLALVWHRRNDKPALRDFLAFVTARAAGGAQGRSHGHRRTWGHRPDQTTHAVRRPSVAPVPAATRSRISSVQHFALPPAFSSSDRSTPIGW